MMVCSKWTDEAFADFFFNLVGGGKQSSAFPAQSNVFV
jgi:hypothetical protein